MATVLLVQESESMQESLVTMLESEGLRVKCDAGFAEARKSIDDSTYDVAIVDLKLGELDSFEFTQVLRNVSPFTEIILISSINSFGIESKFMQCGVFDYIARPFELEQLLHKVEQALNKKNLSVRIQLLENELKEMGRQKENGNFSEEVFSVLNCDLDFPDNGEPILISGENGSGKETLARHFHATCSRKHQPIVLFDCNRIEAENHVQKLFGESGPGLKNSSSYMSLAADGILIIDNIESLAGEAQARLTEKLGPLYRNEENVRIIALTEVSLDKKVESGWFKEELFAILDRFHCKLKPLRNCREGLSSLIDFFVIRLREKYEKKDLVVTDRAMKFLMEYNWPGNIEQLKSALEHAVSGSNGKLLPTNLPEEIIGHFSNILNSAVSSDMTLAELEREYIYEILEKVSWNKTRAAEKLGITRATLLNKLKSYRTAGEAEVA